MNSKSRIVILGAAGFIGSNLTKSILQDNNFHTLTLITRKPVRNNYKNFSKVMIRSCDHLNIVKLRKILENTDLIYHTAGLAWQHPGTGNVPRVDLLIEQLLQNTVSAYFIGSVLQSNQTLIWVSTNAVDSALCVLSKTQRSILEDETERLIECLQVQKNLFTVPTKVLRDIVWKLIVNHILYSFPFAIEFSYAYSKYVGQKILERMSKENIRILGISDVYGPGQNIGRDVIRDETRARRIQRFVGLYKLIREGSTKWISANGKKTHGFFKTSSGIIVQEVWNDFVFPTYIDDVVTLIKRVGSFSKKSRITLRAHGNKISNRKMIETIRDHFQTDVVIRTNNSVKIKRCDLSDDLSTFGISRKSLISFRQGLGKWLDNV